ncbi:MAG: flagellar FlbD family protein [Caldilineaceae bacterium]|nr:flagellar FlbD family protein [Caldilineaceae bacterium]
MIDVTRLDGRSFTLNADLIEVVESNPDTYIRLQNGNSFVVRESRQEIVQRVIAFRRQLYQDCLSTDEAVISAQMQPARGGS